MGVLLVTTFLLKSQKSRMEIYTKDTLNYALVSGALKVNSSWSVFVSTQVSVRWQRIRH